MPIIWRIVTSKSRLVLIYFWPFNLHVCWFEFCGEFLFAIVNCYVERFFIDRRPYLKFKAMQWQFRRPLIEQLNIINHRQLSLNRQLINFSCFTDSTAEATRRFIGEGANEDGAKYLGCWREEEGLAIAIRESPAKSERKKRKVSKVWKEVAIMPIAALVRSISLPNLKIYTTVSLLLVSGCLYYAFDVVRTDPQWKLHHNTSHHSTSRSASSLLKAASDASAVLSSSDLSSLTSSLVMAEEKDELVRDQHDSIFDESNMNETGSLTSQLKDVVSFMTHEPVCIWVSHWLLIDFLWICFSIVQLAIASYQLCSFWAHPLFDSSSPVRLIASHKSEKLFSQPLPLLESANPSDRLCFHNLKASTEIEVLLVVISVLCFGFFCGKEKLTKWNLSMMTQEKD